TERRATRGSSASIAESALPALALWNAVPINATMLEDEPSRVREPAAFNDGSIRRSDHANPISVRVLQPAPWDFSAQGRHGCALPDLRREGHRAQCGRRGGPG